MWRFLKHYDETGSKKRGSGRPTVITDGVKKIVEDAMNHDDETTLTQLQPKLQEKGYYMSKRTVGLNLGGHFGGAPIASSLARETR